SGWKPVGCLALELCSLGRPLIVSSLKLCASSPVATLFKTPAVPAYSLASGPNLRSSVTGALVVARQSHVARTARRNNNLPRLLVGVSPGCGLPVMGSNQPGAPGPLI